MDQSGGDCNIKPLTSMIIALKLCFWCLMFSKTRRRNFCIWYRFQIPIEEHYSIHPPVITQQSFISSNSHSCCKAPAGKISSTTTFLKIKSAKVRFLIECKGDKFHLQIFLHCMSAVKTIFPLQFGEKMGVKDSSFTSSMVRLVHS